jgi:hypothetical protein
MPTQTRQQAEAPRVRTPSVKVRLNQKPIAPPRKKRAKVAKFIHPPELHDLTSEVSNPASSEEPLRESKSPEPEDVSQTEYTLSTGIILNDVAIHNDTILQRLGEFNHRQFEVDSIRRVTKAVEASKAEFEWLSGAATISAKGVVKANMLIIQVEEHSQWLRVETFVERWMRDHKRDINVKLVLNYKTKSRGYTESSTEDATKKKVRDL